MQKTAIVVPCYNEYNRLRINQFKNFIENNNEVYFIFVNDGSTDNTHKIINDFSRFNHERILCIDLKKNAGKAEAVRKGFLKAIDMGFDNIGYWDADLATPLKFINKFCELLNCYNKTIVLGSRVKMLGHKVERHAVRHYLGRFFATFASIVLKIDVYDTQCGAKIFRNNPDLQTVFSRPFITKWIFDVEILARFIRISRKNNGPSIEEFAIEYPLQEWIHVSGSKIKLRDFFISFFELVKIYLTLNYSYAAKKLFKTDYV